MNAPQNSETPQAQSSKPMQRRRALFIVTLILLSVGGGAALYWFFIGQWTISTDDAYVGGNVIQVTPQVSGTVVSVLTDDTELVQAGQPLVKLDATDAEVQLQLAQANLAEAVRAVRGLFANDNQSQAVVVQRAADIDKARFEVKRLEAEVRKARDEYQRRQALFQQKFISKENLQTAKTDLDSVIAQLEGSRAAVNQAEAAIRQAREQRTGTAVLVDNTSLETHPRVSAAAANVKDAYLALARSTIVAPVSGYVGKRSVQVGQRVSPGASLMAIVPLDNLWVDANFKESQLKHVRIGQPVSLTADLYGSDVTYEGHVVGLAPGTGGVFSLLPAQNATGNWIKIVQRVPVRISLDEDALAQHPLRVGLSMLVDIDTHERSGAILASKPNLGERFGTQVFDAQAAEADALIARIIEANRQGGKKS